MIPHESFTYGLINDSIKFVPSSNHVKKMLKQQSLDYLIGLSLSRNQDTEIIEQHFPTEDIISITQLSRIQDDFGRPMTNNHTILIRTSDYLKVYPPRNLVQHLFKK